MLADHLELVGKFVLPAYGVRLCVGRLVELSDDRNKMVNESDQSERFQLICSQQLLPYLRIVGDLISVITVRTLFRPD